MFQASVPGQFAKNVHRSLRCMEAVAVHAGTQLSCTMLCLMKCCLMLLYTAEPNLTIISFMLLIMTHLRIGMWHNAYVIAKTHKVLTKAITTMCTMDQMEAHDFSSEGPFTCVGINIDPVGSHAKVTLLCMICGPAISSHWDLSWCILYGNQSSFVSWVWCITWISSLSSWRWLTKVLWMYRLTSWAVSKSALFVFGHIKTRQFQNCALSATIMACVRTSECCTWHQTLTDLVVTGDELCNCLQYSLPCKLNHFPKLQLWLCWNLLLPLPFHFPGEHNCFWNTSMVYLHFYGFAEVLIFLKMVACDEPIICGVSTLQETMSKGLFRVPLFCESLFCNHSRAPGEQNEVFFFNCTVLFLTGLNHLDLLLNPISFLAFALTWSSALMGWVAPPPMTLQWPWPSYVYFSVVPPPPPHHHHHLRHPAHQPAASSSSEWCSTLPSWWVLSS